MSWLVSINSASTPPSIRPSACNSYASLISFRDFWPSDGSFELGKNPDGPIVPITYLGLSANS